MRETGDWEAWVRFFLRGIVETASQAVSATRTLLDLFESDRRRIETLGRPAGSALQVHGFLGRRPIVGIPEVAQALPLSRPTVAAALGRLEELGLVREITGRERDRIFVYSEYLALLNEATEPLPR